MEKYEAVFRTDNGDETKFTLFMPAPDYAGYGNGISSKLGTTGGGTSEYFDERYNKNLSRKMSLQDFRKYVVERILPQFHGARAETLCVRETR